MRTLVLFLAAVPVITVPAAPAQACWDGYRAETDRVTLTGDDDAWNPARIREIATWARRFEALLGPDGTLEAEMGWGTACIGERCVEVRVRTTEPDALFRAVATALGIRPPARAAALGANAAPFTVQVAASRNRGLAEDLAARLSELDLPMGFVEVGGFPADNPEVHVVDAIDAAGRPVHRVVVGAFLDRREASARAREITERTGLPTLLRAL